MRKVRVLVKAGDKALEAIDVEQFDSVAEAVNFLGHDRVLGMINMKHKEREANIVRAAYS